MARIVTQDRRPTTNEAETQKKEAQLWLNIGYTMTDPETGEDLFISLPLGIPLDTQAEVKVRGKEESTREMLTRKNMLLSDVLGVGAQLDAGEAETVEGLEIQIRRVADKQAAPDTSNFERPQISLVPKRA